MNAIEGVPLKNDFAHGSYLACVLDHAMAATMRPHFGGEHFAKTDRLELIYRRPVPADSGSLSIKVTDVKPLTIHPSRKDARQLARMKTVLYTASAALSAGGRECVFATGEFAQEPRADTVAG